MESVQKGGGTMEKKVPCWKCGGSGRVPRELPPFQRNAPGIPQDKTCDVCEGKGWVWE